MLLVGFAWFVGGRLGGRSLCEPDCHVHLDLEQLLVYFPKDKLAHRGQWRENEHEIWIRQQKQMWLVVAGLGQALISLRAPWALSDRNVWHTCFCLQ